MKKGIFAKNSFKRLLAYLIAFVFICAINQKMEVRADSSTTISFGETYEGTTANGGINKYYFELPEAGRITINLNSQSWLGWELLDSSYNDIDSAGKTGTSRVVYDLIPGKYELNIMQDYNHNKSDYTVLVHFESAHETFTYDNNMYIDVATQAAIPYSQKIIGQLAVNDTIDYYKLEMPFDGTVKFSLLANMREVKMTIRNSQDEVLDFAYFKENGLNYSCALKKGTYYLCFTQVYGTGTYWFTASSEIKTPVNVAVNASSATSVKVTATKSGEISGYEIRYKKGSGSWKNIVKTGNKNLNTNITDLAPGTYNVQVRAYCAVSGKKYYSNWSDIKSVTCQLKKSTSLKVKNSVSKGMKITAKKSGTITGYTIRYKKNSGSWKSVKVKTNKNLNKTIKKLKKGSVYKVQVRTYCVVSGKTYHSQWSNTVSVKIKK